VNVCRRCLVSGRVQGVFFRASTRDRALQLGLSGYARNLLDGRVEVVACGERSALDALREWLWQGPPAAQVQQVDCQAMDDAHWEGFVTR
jgi:acylphosphatase